VILREYVFKEFFAEVVTMVFRLKEKISSKEHINESLITIDPIIDFLNPIKKSPVFKEAALA